MATSTSTQVKKLSDLLASLRVLVVDDDLEHLRVVEETLRSYHYNVTACSKVMEAQGILRKKKVAIDVVLCNVSMPGLDVFDLLRDIKLETDPIVILMSEREDNVAAMKAMTDGACAFIGRPVQMNELKNMWQHVVRNRRYMQGISRERSRSVENGDEENGKEDLVPVDNCKNKSHPNKRQHQEVSPPRELRNGRFVWRPELHEKFVIIVEQLGGAEKATPKKILAIMRQTMMRKERPTRENIASHLQKYRENLKKDATVKIQPYIPLETVLIENVCNDVFPVDFDHFMQQSPTMMQIFTSIPASISNMLTQEHHQSIMERQIIQYEQMFRSRGNRHVDVQFGERISSFVDLSSSSQIQEVQQRHLNQFVQETPQNPGKVTFDDHQWMDPWPDHLGYLGSSL